MLKTIHNVETGEITTREMTEEEIAAVESVSAEQNRRKAEAEAKAQAKAAAEAKLAALGLTSDDLKALGLGGN
jgi:hypothetical protein